MHQTHLAIHWRTGQGTVYALDCAGQRDGDYSAVHLDEIDGVDQEVREAVARAVRARMDSQASQFARQDLDASGLTVVTRGSACAWTPPDQADLGWQTLPV
ncbi:hypothetical protein [Actinomyces wuliandei]|uniref:hypothetical protein n=1 Tax=Actinomyces wuliandei TaxID=2057743 RepID=UPI000FDB9D3B|nr:hypothetical protein [Actinomyces wuliandei]